MTAVPKSNEPSMEEILASIRRIIADDQAVGAAKAAQPEAAKPAPAPPPPVEEEPLDLATEAEPATPLSQDDLDLLFADPAPAALAEPEPDPEPEPEPEPEPPPPPPVAVQQSPVRVEPAPMSAAAFQPAVEDALLSGAASASVAGAFANLSHTLLSSNARTLEDLVKEMMRPMLKTWLDDNLPSIVERLVRAEIERVARGGR